MSLPAKSQFEKHAQDPFHIAFGSDVAHPCQVKEVKTGVQPNNPEFNEQFSVVFTCPETQVFEQGVYQVKHEQLGEFELFLVPIFGDQQGVDYEAVFT